MRTGCNRLSLCVATGLVLLQPIETKLWVSYDLRASESDFGLPFQPRGLAVGVLIQFDPEAPGERRTPPRTFLLRKRAAPTPGNCTSDQGTAISTSYVSHCLGKADTQSKGRSTANPSGLKSEKEGQSHSPTPLNHRRPRVWFL